MSNHQEHTLEIKYTLQKGDFYSSINITIPGKGITALFGPSGSGKTTLLRFIAGLEKIKGGQLRFGSHTWQNEKNYTPTHKRPIAYVFQEASLFEHLTVEKNLYYGWKRKAATQANIHYNDVVSLMGIGSLLNRYSSQLSGGQRQRVSIARALLCEPKLLLMDEPLAALDTDSKTDILPYLEKLHEELSIPIIYVSHAVQEVVRIADTMVLIDNGKIIKTGPINELMTNPELPLATLEEACAVVNGIIDSHDSQFYLTHIKIPAGLFSVSQLEFPTGKSVRLRILARDVSLTLTHQHETSISNIFPVEILAFFPTNTKAHIMVKLNASGTTLLSRITVRSKEQLKLTVGQIVYAQIKAVSLLRKSAN